MTTIVHTRGEDLASGDSVHATCSCLWVSAYPASTQDLATQFLVHQADGTVPEYLTDGGSGTPVITPVTPLPSVPGSALPGPVT